MYTSGSRNTPSSSRVTSPCHMTAVQARENGRNEGDCLWNYFCMLIWLADPDGWVLAGTCTQSFKMTFSKRYLRIKRVSNGKTKKCAALILHNVAVLHKYIYGVKTWKGVCFGGMCLISGPRDVQCTLCQDAAPPSGHLWSQPDRPGATGWTMRWGWPKVPRPQRCRSCKECHCFRASSPPNAPVLEVMPFCHRLCDSTCFSVSLRQSAELRKCQRFASLKFGTPIFTIYLIWSIHAPYYKFAYSHRLINTSCLFLLTIMSLWPTA